MCRRPTLGPVCMCLGTDDYYSYMHACLCVVRANGPKYSISPTVPPVAAPSKDRRQVMCCFLTSPAALAREGSRKKVIWFLVLGTIFEYTVMLSHVRARFGQSCLDTADPQLSDSSMAVDRPCHEVLTMQSDSATLHAQNAQFHLVDAVGSKRPSIHPARPRRSKEQVQCDFQSNS